MSITRIAVVDDDATFAEYLATFLRTRDYDATVFATGRDLLDSLKKTTPDLILLDMSMPGMDGIETLKAVQAARPELPVVMVSGRQAPSGIVDAVRSGAVDYVVKPADGAGLEEAALEATISRVLERASLREEVANLSARVTEAPDGSQVCWSSGPAMQHVLQMVDRVADTDATVLLTGESGVGKEVIAREIHRRSGRRPGPFVKLNCAALPTELLESELFGHERGAFTGAQAARVGKFAAADHGTLLLDEIGEMSVTLQAKLLHVLQDQTFTRLGSNDPVKVDVRVVAATNCDLAAMIREGTFREDLYYRLQVIEIQIPPLRDRQEEIVPLAEFFLQRSAKRHRRRGARLTAALRTALRQYPWPGNIRELENMIKRWVILGDEQLLLTELRHPGPSPSDAESSRPDHDRSTATKPETPVVEISPTRSLTDIARSAAQAAERSAIEQALGRCMWNRKQAAQLLGVSYKTLLNKMKRCHIVPPDPPAPPGA